ncbi:MAG TPA: response regulator [Tepidisphaeraceae bacterium]|nr:response regulator [Tepidisphaeraceae bacterium]
MQILSGPSLRILVVDDHADSAAFLARLLRKDGHHVTVADGRVEAVVAAARLADVDLLISDITLPDGDGCELLRLLNDRTRGGPRHAVALTGHGDPALVEECRRAGYAHVLVKPVAYSQVLAAIATARAAASPPTGFPQEQSLAATPQLPP